MTSSYAFRAVQMDLARQMEPLPEIKKFIDIIAKNGYNTLFLYLEGRVRTESFPYPADNECYTPEEMCELVDYAASKKIDIVPGLSCLGHAELFLKHEAMTETAELRDDREGRFWKKEKMVFCPSQLATRNFLEKYITEISEIFPGKYIHVGLDEAWDIGYCDKCGPVARNFRGEQQLFLDVVNFCQEVVAGKLGRRVMMWDDMFEYYSDILPEIPRDVIMVCWQYQMDVRFIKGHFDNLSCEHKLAEYNRLGFETVIGPADYSTANIRTIHEYAKPYAPWGMLVTSWEKKNSFRSKSLPAFIYGGRLCSCDPNKDQEIFTGIVKDLFGCDDKLLVNAVQAFSEQKLLKEGLLTLDALLAVPFFGLDYGEDQNRSLLKTALEKSLPDVKTESGREIISDMLLSLDFHLIKFRLHKTALQLFDPGLDSGDVESGLDTVIAGFEQLRRQRINEWSILRRGISPCNYDSMYQHNIDLAKKLPEIADKHGVLMVRFCLPDLYSAEHSRLSLKYNGQWQEVKTGTFKCMEANPFWNFFIPIDKNLVPEAFKIECKGYGGQGIAYVEANNAAGHFIPAEVINTSGEVITPEYIMRNDCKWCFIGEKDTLKAFRNRKLAEAIHSVEIKLKRG